MRKAVLGAAMTLLAADEELTVERLAERAGVNKTTIYRRWTDLDGLLGDVLLHYGLRTVPIPDTGTLDQDLKVLAESLQSAITHRPAAKIVIGLTAAAARSERAAQVLREFFHERFGLAKTIVDRAVARGEVDPDTDAFVLIEALGSPFYLRLLVTRDPIDVTFAQRVAAMVGAAAMAGVFALSKG